MKVRFSMSNAPNLAISDRMNHKSAVAWLTRLKGGMQTESLQTDAQNQALALLEELIATDTTSSTLPELAKDTSAGTEKVGRYLQNAGAEVSYGEPEEFPVGSGKLHKPMIAVFYPKDEAKRNRPARMISGHIDTVPALETDWDGHDPHNLHFDGKKYIGRGVIDMKGPVASAAASLATLAKNGKLDDLEQPLVFALSSLEEVGVLGVPGIAKLMHEKKITPHEIMVLEPSEGYVATGGKGSIQERFTTEPILHPRAADPWPHTHTITIHTEGGHSSILGASPADPALLASTVILPEIEKLRKEGVPIEVCEVHYGKASNIVGGDLTLTIGYGDGNEAHDQKVQEFFDKTLKEKERSANKTLSIREPLANAWQWVQNEVGGLKLGQVAITHAADQPAKEHMRSFRRSDGLRSHQDAETLLNAAAAIYTEHGVQQKNNAKGYVIPALGRTKLSVTLLHAGEPGMKSSLTYDMRFPMEAMKGSGIIPKAEDLAETIAKNIAESGIHALSRERVFDLPAYDAGLSQRDTENLAWLAKLSGVKSYDSLATHVPNGSDGNRLAYEFPNAIVTDVMPGGFANNIHGINESWSEKHLNAATNFMLEYATMPMLGQRRENTLGREGISAAR